MPPKSSQLKLASPPPASDDLPEGPTDLQLVEKLRAGDALAGDQLVRRHTPALLGFLRKTVGSSHLAEDLHQATWASALQHLPKFDAKKLPVAERHTAFKAWLFRIAANKARDAFRSAGRARKHQQTFADDPGLRPENPSGGAEALDDERQTRVREAIDQLPEAQKEVVVLRYYAQMKFSDVAAVVGCPLNTALGRMHKAALKLKAMLGDDFLQ